MLENLEPRRLFHTFTLSHGLLTLITHPDSETIGLRIIGPSYIATIDEEGVSESFPAAKVKHVLIQALQGDDSINVNPDVNVPMTIQAGDGNDTVFAGAGPTVLEGDDGDDSLVDGGGDDTFVGGTGNDTADFSARSDNLSLVIGAGPVSGAKGQQDDLNSDIETVFGGSGKDFIYGARINSDELLMGNGGNDGLVGGGGSDTLSGGSGNDFLTGGGGADMLVGGPGKKDAADYGVRTEDLSLTLDSIANDGAPGENDDISPTVEDLFGGSGNDFLQGNGRANYLSGGAGNDTIYGGSGDDTLVGLTGKDHLYGQAGRDVLFAHDGEHDTVSGGSGMDLLVTSDPVDVIDSTP